MRPGPSTTDTFLAGGIVFWAILQRVNDERAGYRAAHNSPIARPFGLADAIEIATPCQTVAAGRKQGDTLAACAFVFGPDPLLGFGPNQPSWKVRLPA